MAKKKTNKVKELENTGEIEIDIHRIDLEELLIALGAGLYAGVALEEVDTRLLMFLGGLTKQELRTRSVLLIEGPEEMESFDRLCDHYDNLEKEPLKH